MPILTRKMASGTLLSTAMLSAALAVVHMNDLQAGLSSVAETTLQNVMSVTSSLNSVTSVTLSSLMMGTTPSDSVIAGVEARESKNPTEAEGIAFLKEKKGEEDVIALDSGLMYKVLRKGKGEFHPTVRRRLVTV
tara:strand:- start:629 stop:1033 length:405 start_codon:yes stop_codon:yes gene_type:complete